MSGIKAFYERFKGKKYAYFVSYTALFCLFSLLIFCYFPLYHKGFIWQQDGLKQHYNGLLYYSKYLKGIIGTLLSGGGLHIPKWDFSIGYGSDIITTLHYYAIGDPLTLLSAFVPLSLMEFFYAGLFFLRSYIGGLGFSLMSLCRGNRRFYTLMGALIYCFAAFGLVLGLMHGIFMVPVCYFPWMIYGVDRIFEKKRPVIFILSTAAAAAANFYFFYMELLLTVFYIIHKFICSEEDRYDKRQEAGVYVKDLLVRVGEFLLYGLNAFLLCAVVLLPVLSVMFSSERFAARKYIPLLYPFRHYMQLISNFMVTKKAGSWTLMGFTVIGALSLILIFSGKEEDKEIKRLRFRFAVLSVFAMIPFFGFMINGFAYVTNRWTFAWALSAAMVTATVLPQAGKRIKENRTRMVMILSVLSAGAVLFFFVRSEEALFSYVLLLLLCILLISGVLPEKYMKPVLFAFLSLSLIFNGWYAYSTADSDFLNEFRDFHAADRSLNSPFPGNMLEGTEGEGFFRTEVSGVDNTQNSSIQTGFKGTQFYFSLTSPYISDFINSLYLNWPKDYDYDGVESREGLEALAGVKYFITGEDTKYKVPAGFVSVTEGQDDSGNKAFLYKNENALPLGYSTKYVIGRNDLDAMNAAGRQNALLSGAVLSEKDKETLVNAGFSEGEIRDDSENVFKKIESKGDMDIDSNSFTVRRNASVLITFEGRKNAETYVVFKGLEFRGFKEREMYDEGAWAGLTPFERSKVMDKNTTDSRPSVTSLMLINNGHEQIVEFYNYKNDYYCGRENFLVNLGDTGEGEGTVQISFRESGVYSFDSLEVISQPTDSVTERIKEFKDSVMENITVGEDSVSGTFTSEDDRILMLSIPYNPGWKAYVDGKETEILRADLMYMAVPVVKGTHNIELKYETPFLKTGALMGIFGIIMLFVILYRMIKITHHL